MRVKYVPEGHVDGEEAIFICEHCHKKNESILYNNIGFIKEVISHQLCKTCSLSSLDIKFLEFQQQIKHLLKEISYLEHECERYPSVEIKDIKLKIKNISELMGYVKKDINCF